MQPMGRISVANLYKTLITLNSRRRTPPPFQLYSTAAVHSDCDSDSVVTTHNVDDNDSSSSSKKPIKKKRGKDKLLSKISPLGDLSCNFTSIIDEWVKTGNKVRFAEVQRVIRDFRKLNRFTEALRVSEWLKNNEAFTFSPVEHAVHIDLIGKVLGILSAETYFNNLSEQDKTEKTYSALLHCYVNNRDTIKALSHVQSMKEKGLKLSSVGYNSLMSLYTKTDKREMKEDGVTLLDEIEKQQPAVSVDWTTCALVASFYSKEGLTAKANGLLKLAEEKLSVGDVDGDGDGYGDGYTHLISLHAILGNKSEVYRLWSLKKNTKGEKLVNRDYYNILSNLVKLDELEEAEKLLEEWKSSENHYDNRIPYIFIDKYIAKKEYVKAEGMLKDMIEKGKRPDMDYWGRVVAGYLDLGNTTSAVECMKIALSKGKDKKKWKPDHSLMTRLLDVLGVEEHAKSDIDTLVGTFLTRTSSEEKTNASSSLT